jgi:AraC-like DNA-binding protein
MSIGFINIIMLIAVAQGFLLSLLIFQKYRKLYANRFLSVLMLLYSLTIFNMLLTDLQYNLRYPHLILSLYIVTFMIAPLHYLYARHLTDTSRKLIKKDSLHFLPALIYFLYISPNFLKSRVDTLSYLQTFSQEGFTPEYLIFYWLLPLQCFCYLFLTLVILKCYTGDIKEVFSSIDRIKLGWLRNITYIFIAVLVIFFIENLFYLEGSALSPLFSLTSLLFAIAVYTMGYMGLLKSEIFREYKFTESMSQVSQIHYRGKMQPGKREKASKYEKSGLSAEKAKNYLEHLMALMNDEKPYQDNSLTLSQLAKMLEISAHNLSEILNTRIKQNFFDFINQYRVEQAKKDLIDPEKQHLKILAIGFQAGFNSKTSFNTIFKKITTLTPSAYRLQALKKKAS